MIGIGNMLWRIGDMLDFDAQLAWTREAGFDGVGFHASAGVEGQWSGIEPARYTGAERASLRDELSGFTFREIHAPFAIDLTRETLASGIEALGPVLGLAADVDASVVTVHAQPDETGDDGSDDLWLDAMTALDEQATRAGTTIGLEITDGFDTVRDWGFARIGVTLDVGHMYDRDRRQSLARRDGIGGLIRRLGPALVHLHLHDTDGVTDHCEVGTGIVDFAETCAALVGTGYRRGVTLEMNPDRCSPAGIVRSAARMRDCIDEAER